jgi:hypothetical protein
LGVHAFLPEDIAVAEQWFLQELVRRLKLRICPTMCFEVYYALCGGLYSLAIAYSQLCRRMCGDMARLIEAECDTP